MAVYLSDICAIILIWNLLAWCFELSYCGCVLSCGYSCWGQFLLTPCLHHHPETARLTGYPLYLYPVTCTLYLYAVPCTCTLYLYTVPVPCFKCFLFSLHPPTSTYPSPLASHTVLYLSASTFCLQYFLVPPPTPHPSLPTPHPHTHHTCTSMLFLHLHLKKKIFISFLLPVSHICFLS